MGLFSEPQSSVPKKDGLHLTLHFDGGSRGNPGPAGIGLVLYDHEKTPLYELGEFLGVCTNNVAEYTALLRGLTAAKTFKAASVKVFSDSELLVRQINGQYKVKSPDLLPLYQQARKLIGEIGNVTVAHVYREKNKRADELANLAMDGKTKIEPMGGAWTPGTPRQAPVRVVAARVEESASVSPAREGQLKKILTALEPVRAVDGKLTVEELDLLLRIARKPGITTGELGDALKKSPTAVDKLLQPGLMGKYELVYTDNRDGEGAEDAVYLTEKGDRLAAQLLAAFE